MHETQEKLKDDQLERELAEMELETLKLEALHDYEEAIHQKIMDEVLWTIITWKEIYSIYYWSKLQALLWHLYAYFLYWKSKLQNCLKKLWLNPQSTYLAL